MRFAAVVTGTEDELGHVAHGILAVAYAHRHDAESEAENHVGKGAEQLGKRHRPAGKKPVDIRVPRLVRTRAPRLS